MFFKKKKAMSDNVNNGNTNADNLAQNEEMDETLSNQNENDETDTDDSNAEVEKLKAEVAEQKDKFLRMMAEFENYKRRNAKEKQELALTGGKDIVESLLVVLDDVDRASKQLEQTNDITVLKEGVALVFNKFKNIMHQKGLKAMVTGADEFNPDLHEAITEIPAPNENMKGKIIDVIEPGYYYNDKLIRYAKVVVGN